MLPLNLVKVGGAVVEDPASLQSFLKRFSSLDGYKVLAHGGGRAATALAARMGVETVMVGGRRVTDAEMLRIVTMVYGGLVNKNVVASLNALGVKALGLTGADLGYMLSRKRPSRPIDFGFVGDVEAVDVSLLTPLIFKGVVPVLAPLTHDGHGQLLNTNADTIASEAAKAFAGLFDVTLTFCFEKPGVLSDPDDDGSVIERITPGAFEKLKADGTVSGGMIPKLENAFAAIDAGVKRVVITSAVTLGEGQGTVICRN